MLTHEPVKPSKMSLVFIYECPFCHNEIMLSSPMTPASVKCGSCRNVFPIVPVDRQTVQFIHTMLMNGRAAAVQD